MQDDERRAQAADQDVLAGAAMLVTADEWRNLPGDEEWKNEMVESQRVIVRET